MAYERGSDHSQADVDAMIEALRIAKQKGLCRHTGFSTHDARWARKLIETYSGELELLCMPYTIISKQAAKNSLLDTLQKHDVGVLGIKPFASNSLFKGDGSPDSPHAEEDDRLRAAGHPQDPQQSRHHRPDSRPDQHAPGGQRGGGHSRTADA